MPCVYLPPHPRSRGTRSPAAFARRSLSGYTLDRSHSCAPSPFSDSPSAAAFSHPPRGAGLFVRSAPSNSSLGPRYCRRGGYTDREIQDGARALYVVVVPGAVHGCAGERYDRTCVSVVLSCIVFSPISRLCLRCGRQPWLGTGGAVASGYAKDHIRHNTGVWMDGSGTCAVVQPTSATAVSPFQVLGRVTNGHLCMVAVSDGRMNAAPKAT